MSVSPLSVERPSILIVEDETGPRDALRIILRPLYTLHAVETAEAAIRLIQEQPVDLITLDLKLPDRHGMELLRQIRLERDDVEVVIITGYGSLKSAMDGLRYGVAGYLLKPFNVADLIRLIETTLDAKRRLDRLRQFLRTSGSLWTSEHDPAAVWELLGELYWPQGRPALKADGSADWEPLLSDLLLAKSRNFLYHCNRVTTYAGLLADALQLGAAERKALATGALLHDIGLLGLPDWLQDRPFSVEESCSEEMRRHPEVGARMVLPLNVPAEVTQVLTYHHERFDGSGFPHGLQGEGIPLLARIVGLAEEFDHLVAGPRALPIEQALAEVQRRAGTYFDPGLVASFTRAAADAKGTLPALGLPSKPAAVPPS